MKKIILSLFVIAMVAVLGVGLVACNNATPQGQLANILSDHNQETFVYQAVNTKDDTTGVYTVKLRAYDKGSNVQFGSRELTNVSRGICITGKLVFDDTVYEMGCYYNLISGMSYMTPAYSFRNVKVDGKEKFDMQGEYADGKFNCDYTTSESGTLSDSDKVSGTVFDNNQFQQVLRSVTTFSSGLSLAFTTPIVNAQGVTNANLTASGNSTAKVKDVLYVENDESIKEDGIDCYVISISRSTQVAGLSQTLYYAVDDVKCDGWGLKHVLVKIIEPFTFEGERYEMQYKLISASIS